MLGEERSRTHPSTGPASASDSGTEAPTNGHRCLVATYLAKLLLVKSWTGPTDRIGTGCADPLTKFILPMCTVLCEHQAVEVNPSGHYQRYWHYFRLLPGPDAITLAGL